MKAILISIRPEWVAKILNGEKTIEIRKTDPKCNLPIDVYIYCTKGGEENLIHNRNGWLMSEFATTYVNGERVTHNYKGKVVAKFTLDVVYEYDIKEKSTWVDSDFAEVMKKLSAMSLYEINKYAGNHFYAWHISDLVIFDEPMELSELKFRKEYHSCEKCPHAEDENDIVVCENRCIELLTVKRAPQSWQYVEVQE